MENSYWRMPTFSSLLRFRSGIKRVSGLPELCKHAHWDYHPECGGASCSWRKPQIMNEHPNFQKLLLRQQIFFIQSLFVKGWIRKEFCHRRSVCSFFPSSSIVIISAMGSPKFCNELLNFIVSSLDELTSQGESQVQIKTLLLGSKYHIMKIQCPSTIGPIVPGRNVLPCCAPNPT